MNFIARLMPREGRFFNHFDNHAKLIVDGALAMADVLRHYDNGKDRAAGIKLIEDAEHGADRITHDTVQLQDTAESLVLYDIQKITPEATQLAELLLRCAERVQSAVGLMASMADAPAILKICQEIDKLESEADRVTRSAIS